MSCKHYLMEVANFVNKWPVGSIVNDPDDGAYLCPNDMMLGRVSRNVPHGSFRESQDPYH